MDDIEDRNFFRIADGVMDTFISKNQSLVLGVVMSRFGVNAPIVDKVADGYKKGLFEVDGHGWQHVFFNGTGYDQQKTWLSSMSTKIQFMFGRPPAAFIPPLAPFDTDTLRVMNELGIKVLSSEYQVDKKTLYLGDGSNKTDDYGIYHVPATAKFYDYSSNIGIKVPVEKVLDDIDNSITKHGWAVVVMHPQDFAETVNGTKINQINQAEIDDLSQIIDSQVSKQRRIVTFSQLTGLSLGPLIDRNAPSIKAPQDIALVSSQIVTSVDIGKPTVVDLIDPSPIITNDIPTGGFKLGTTVVNWTAIDSSGNSAYALQYVTIADTADYSTPTISIVSPTDITYGPSSGLMLDITGKAFDRGGSGIKRIEVRSSLDRTFVAAVPLKANDWSTWEVTLNIKQSGDHTIIAKAVDYFENQRTTSMPLTVVLSDKILEPTKLTLESNAIPELSFGKPTLKVTGRLTEINQPNVGIGNQTIAFMGLGEGLVNFTSAITNLDGTFTASGPAPNEDLSSGWTIQANYVGDGARYRASRSNVIDYDCFSLNLVHFCSSFQTK